MGPNGVGKSTFAHALMGNPVYQTDGAAQLNGKDLLSMETFERAEAGLFLGFQTPTPIEGLSNFQLINQVLNKQENYSLLDNLNKFQKEAVLCISGPLLIVAGAGSGKTKVLTSRIANIILGKKAFPNQILAVTFTTTFDADAVVKFCINKV